MAHLALARRARPWRVASDALKRRSPGTWHHLAEGWSRLETTLAPVDLVMDYPLSFWVGFRNRASFRSVHAFVMFVGYPRSGHTIVESLLNAHPNIVIGHRFRVLRYVRAGYRSHQVNGMALAADRRFGRMGRVGSKRYDYSVPNQWQGRFNGLQVIGDGNVTNSFLRRQPELLGRLRDIVGVPVKVIHVVRNPFDNIATVSIRNRLSLADAADYYFDLCEGTTLARAACSAQDWMDVRHEQLLDDPQDCLRRLCDFVGVPAAEGYLRDCAGILYRNPHRSRHDVVWPPELLDAVAARTAAVDFLDGYRYEEPAEGSKG